MDYIHKLPFILGASMAVIIGVVSNKTGVESKIIYIRMSVGLIAFFVLGLYIRSIICKIDEEIRKRKEEELRQKEELENAQIGDGQNHTVDYRVDDNNFELDLNMGKDEKLYDEEFTPLSVNSVTINKDVKDSGR
ncbi:hypothetical protein [Acetivibrio cellulolyticus]|uniref:hypothetical protein n=1 Tax=Acetivibrio cellulolyticus TaxID=35830 RepID=UPI0001E2BDE2|nr:hypothetical protein [Acetivibrio cellulolyticus]